MTQSIEPHKTAFAMQTDMQTGHARTCTHTHSAVQLFDSSALYKYSYLLTYTDKWKTQKHNAYSPIYRTDRSIIAKTKAAVSWQICQLICTANLLVNFQQVIEYDSVKSQKILEYHQSNTKL